MGGRLLLNSLGGLLNRPEDQAYLHEIHRDTHYPEYDFPLMVNAILALDDFTPESSATYLLSGSHRQLAKPTDQLFFAQADRLAVPRGSVVFFDSRIWHCAGKNQTPRPRRALTFTFTRCFVKQQMDYPRLLGEEFAHRLPARVRELIGYDSRVPSTLEEWYQPVDKRLNRTI